jgi:hypothetical protein
LAFDLCLLHPFIVSNQLGRAQLIADEFQCVAVELQTNFEVSSRFAILTADSWHLHILATFNFLEQHAEKTTKISGQLVQLHSIMMVSRTGKHRSGAMERVER